MATLELVNQTDRQFVDISTELVRFYILPGGSELRIENPQYLSVSQSGNHYVVDLLGRVHVIAPGWLYLSWFPKDGAPHLVA